MVFHSVAVGIVVNGVPRTLWVSSRMQNQLREAQALMTQVSDLELAIKFIA